MLDTLQHIHLRLVKMIYLNILKRGPWVTAVLKGLSQSLDRQTTLTANNIYT